MRAHDPDLYAKRNKVIRSLKSNWKPMALAQNTTETSEREDQNQTPQSEKSAGEDSSKNSSEAAKQPLKSFKPSEEIAAEQAVDFPVDI